MATPSRFIKVGTQGGKHPEKNTLDTYQKTYEFTVPLVADDAEQDTGIKLPTGFVQAVSAVVVVETAEATGTTATLSVGSSEGTGADFIDAADVSATGPAGSPELAAIAGGGTITYTLGSDDFAELEAKVVITVFGSDV